MTQQSLYSTASKNHDLLFTPLWSDLLPTPHLHWPNWLLYCSWMVPGICRTCLRGFALVVPSTQISVWLAPSPFSLLYSKLKTSVEFSKPNLHFSKIVSLTLTLTAHLTLLIIFCVSITIWHYLLVCCEYFPHLNILLHEGAVICAYFFSLLFCCLSPEKKSLTYNKH